MPFVCFHLPRHSPTICQSCVRIFLRSFVAQTLAVGNCSLIFFPTFSLHGLGNYESLLYCASGSCRSPGWSRFLFPARSILPWFPCALLHLVLSSSVPCGCKTLYKHYGCILHLLLSGASAYPWCGESDLFC